MPTDFENENYLCQQAIKMIKGLSEFIVSLDAEKYDHRTEERKKYRSIDQWRYNLHLVKQDREKFYEWLRRVEAKLGRKANVIDRVAEYLD